jgi:putative redox protein
MLDYQFQQPVHGEIGTDNYRCSVEWRNGKFISDEPAAQGGKDEGPDPYTLLVSSLVTCTLITLRMYIDRKGWDIPAILVNGNLFRTKTTEGTTTVIDCDIKFPKPVTDEQKERLTEIAAACPISKILEGRIKIRSFVFLDGEAAKQMHYSNNDITVTWKPSLCKHSGRCVSHLGAVFNLNAHPWINMQGAPTEAIIKQVNECPSGALTYSNKSETAKN